MINFALFALALVTHVLAATSGCELTSVTGTGFDVVFYHYPIISDHDVSPSYNVTTYADYGEDGTTSGVTAVNFSGGGADLYEVKYELIYGYNITTSNFSMKLTGYFLATQSGTYSFSIYGDDSIGLSIGSTGSCCGSVSDSVNSSAFTVGGGETATVDATLTAGYYYPVQMLYLNARGGSVILVHYTEPDGTEVSDIGSNVYQISQPSECYTTTTTYWTGAETLTTTETGSETETVIVLLPPDITSTYWTNSYTSTTTLTPSNGKPTVYVELPPAYTTTTWTESYVTTITNTPSSGAQPTVEVRVPEPTTSTSTWTNSYSTTSFLTGPSGDTPLVIVPGTTPVTSTSTWTNSYSTTSFLTGPSGDTPLVIVPGTTPVTSTSTWTNSYSTTSFLTGPSGDTPLVIVPGTTPVSSPLPMNSGGWNLTYTPLATLSSSNDQVSPGVSSMIPSESSVQSPTTTSLATTPNPNSSPEYVTEVITFTTKDTEVPGVTMIRTLTTTRTVCTKCEGSPVKTEQSSASIDTKSPSMLSTTETKTVVMTSTDASGATVVLTTTMTTTYCPTTESPPAGQATTLLTATSCASCISGSGQAANNPGSGGNGGLSSSTLAPAAAVSTYDGGSPIMVTMLYVAILPLLALFF